MGVQWFGFIFRMKLTGYKVRMRFTWELDHLDKFTVWRDPAEYQTLFLECSSKLGIKLVTVTVPFPYLFTAVINVTSQRVGFQRTRPFTQSHGATIFLNIHEVAKFENDRERRFLIKLCR